MSDTLRLVEVAYADDGSSLAHIEGWGPMATPTLQLVPADDLEVGMLTTAVDATTAAQVRTDIQTRSAAGQTPVLKSHLDQMGMTAALLWWSQHDG
jgi:hypothetical protein